MCVWRQRFPLHLLIYISLIRTRRGGDSIRTNFLYPSIRVLNSGWNQLIIFLDFFGDFNNKQKGIVICIVSPCNKNKGLICIVSPCNKNKGLICIVSPCKSKLSWTCNDQFMDKYAVIISLLPYTLIPPPFCNFPHQTHLFPPTFAPHTYIYGV